MKLNDFRGDLADISAKKEWLSIDEAFVCAFVYVYVPLF